MELEWLLNLGYFGLFIGAFLAATLIPFSSDIMLIGILAAGGDIWTSVIVATIGNWLGGLSSYGLGYLGKWEWIEKWFKVKPETLEKQKDKIDKYGSLLAFLTWLPFIGDIFALGLGFYKTNFWKTSLFMLIGKGARFIMWALLFMWGKHLFL